MRWRLLIEEYGLELRYIKGELNIIADVLSRLQLKEEKFSLDAFAFDDEDFLKDNPLSYKEIAFEQKKSKLIQQMLKKNKATMETRKHSSHSYELAVDKDGKILVPPTLQLKATEWYHSQLCHHGNVENLQYGLAR